MWLMAKRRDRGLRVFTAKQNRALRSALLELKTSRKLSQMGLGRLLGIAQQNAGRLLRDRNAGFGFNTAARLARELGFGGVEAFFAAKGLASLSDVGLRETANDMHAKSA